MDGQTLFYIVEVATPNRLAFWEGECWHNKPKTQCCAFGCVCHDPTTYDVSKGVSCVRVTQQMYRVGGLVPSETTAKFLY